MSAAVAYQSPDHGFPTTFGFKVAQKGLEVTTASNPPAKVTSIPAPLDTDTTNVNDHLGWKGLLEISRKSGASGVLGARSGMEDEGTTREAISPKLEICCTAHTQPAIRRLVKSVIRGLKACQEPDKAVDGMGGTYFFSNESGRKVAIFKPCDEEPLAPNNPKGYVGRSLGDPGWKPTVRVGEACMREVAAYLLDHDGFAKVPASVLVRARHPVFCYNSSRGAAANMGASGRQSSMDLNNLGNLSTALAAPAAGMIAAAVASTSTAAVVDDAADEGESPLPMKLGSLQEFVSHECDTSEMGPSRFSASDVHRIGILDIRLFNTDRHAGNMLVRRPRTVDSMATTPSAAGPALPPSRLANMVNGKEQYELIPIDHGFCLPETLEAPYFEWLHWPQALLPFTEEELAYIRKLDVEADKEVLRKELPNLRPECVRVMELSTMVLKRGAEAGLNLYEIAMVLSRGGFGDADEEPSELEKLCASAVAHVETVEEYSSSEDSEDELSDDIYDDIDAIPECEEDEACCANNAAACSMNMSSLMLSGQEDGSGSEHNPAADGEGNSSQGDEAMFDLDEDGGVSGSHAYIKTRSGNFESAHSPSQFSIGSSSISSADHMSFTAGGMVGSRPTNLSTPVGTRCPAMARSVHATDNGFMWRRMKTRIGTKALRQHKSAGPKRASPQAYPPPVVPSAGGPNLSLSAMNEAKWGAVMATVDAQVTAAIREGRWKQRSPREVGMSCPRF